MKKCLLVLLAAALSAAAADISGNWKATADFGGNTIERTFVFKQEGTKVTGETTSQIMGKSVINDGKLEGDTLTFTITGRFQDNEVKMNYKGKVNAVGNEIKMTVEGIGGNTIEWV